MRINRWRCGEMKISVAYTAATEADSADAQLPRVALQLAGSVLTFPKPFVCDSKPRISGLAYYVRLAAIAPV